MTNAKDIIGKALKVLGFVVFMGAGLASCEIASNTPIVDEEHHVAVVSIRSNPLELVDLGMKTGNWLPLELLGGGVVIASILYGIGDHLAGKGDE